MTAILAHIRSISALPLPDPILPKITIRHDFSSQAPSETGLAIKGHFVRATGTHGKRQPASPSEDIKIAPPSTPNMRRPTQDIQSQPFHKRGKGRRPRARFHPLDTDNSTSASSPQISQVPSLSPMLSNSTGSLNFSSPSSQESSVDGSSGMLTFAVTGTATALSTATSPPGIITDTSPPLVPANSTLLAAWIRTLPPTTALSTLVPPVPEPRPNLVTQSWFSGTTPTPITSQSAAGTSVPSQSGNASCPFQASGIAPTPDADTTPDPSFPVIVTVFPVSTSSSAVV
ncbi:uncharacterized protein PV07_12109 [Cladophialophora immunda]|uniref:Uncharacterized protein n=1 Tax=Cladophialophora immunda TaxID=569365 RepID=A0A0D2BT14_9EURO|nr:uncharacterized protein PV07_12109 [Cladophialophora immunda]KIW22198.1 hypothetical protein PV07_12109 [Cladophialophora immunda]OQU99876.1 hypothetical protein CLAIMM_05449 [Cladophialophora immunda]